MHKRLLFLLSLFTFVLSIKIFAGNISGQVTTDSVWTVAGSPVIVTATVTVNNGVTLRIEPGVVVKFDAGTQLIVAGKLLADGKADSVITFTSNAGTPAAGDWNSIEFQNGLNVGSVFDYCLVEYGGSGANAANIFYKTGAYSIAITNCTVRYSQNHGVNVRASSPRIARSTFSDNAGFGIFTDLSLGYTVDTCLVIRNTTGGIRIAVNATTVVNTCIVDSNGTGIYIDASARPTIWYDTIRANTIGIEFTSVGSSQPTIKDNVIMNNTTYGFKNSGTSTVKAEYNYWGHDMGPYNSDFNPTGLGDAVTNYVDFHPWNIWVGAYPVVNVTANITVNTTWSANTVYWIKNDVTVTAGDTLTIAPGTVIKFAAGVSLTISGTIKAGGIDGGMIVFTSEKDDSYGGDSNGDGRVTGPTAGDWETVYLSGGGNNSSILNYCIFKFGGTLYTYAELVVSNCSPSITNIYVTNSSNTGMNMTNSSSALPNCSFSGNGGVGVSMNNVNTTITNSEIVGNGSYGLQALGTSHYSVSNSTISRNGNNGIHTDGGGSRATLLLLDNCTVTQNTGHGVYAWNGDRMQTFSNSTFHANTKVGLWCYNPDSLVTIENNTASNNGEEGFVTSKGFLTNNIISNNRYPIGLAGRCGTRYNGNTITGNVYNNAIALRCNREYLSDTLFYTFPAGMSSKTYVMIENSTSTTTATGTTFVVEPGVIVKFASGLYWRISGRFIADGNDPIIFTSYRDTMYGGKTNLPTDNTPPASGNWGYIELNGTGANNTIMDKCILKYSQYGLNVEGVTLANAISNSTFRKSSNYGVYVTGNSVVSFENCTIDSSTTYGMYVGYYSGDDVTIRGSTIQDNGNHGLYCSYQSGSSPTFREISNCIIRRNNGWGIYVSDGRLPQTYLGNFIDSNATGGISNNNTVYTWTSVMYIGNTVSHHTGEGIVSSSARYIDNTIQYNRYPIAVWRRTGNSYVDNNNIDGNIISNNQYNAVAIYNGSIEGNLSFTFPEDIPSKTYVVRYDFSVSNGDTLVIDPGTRIKFEYFGGYQNFSVNGILLAEGTPELPITWTSWRDNTVGGKTSHATDSLNPAPGDWNYIAYYNGNCKVRHNIFKFGGRDNVQAVAFGNSCNGILFTNNIIRKSYAAGIAVNQNNTITFDSLLIDSCNTYGIRLYGYTTTNLTLKNSNLLKNGSSGVYAESNAKVSEVSNCVISYNGGSGIHVLNTTTGCTIISNTINNNVQDGVNIISRNDALDSLLVITTNKIRNNGRAGIFSSRAYILNDSIMGNQFPFGITGQLNLALTGNTHGNVYENNYISGNTHNEIIALEGNILGRIGGSYPTGFTSNVIAVRGDVTVSGGNTVYIAPGTILKFTRQFGNGLFQVDGRLLSEGTQIYKNVFTSWKDDSYGGDSNADSSATVPGPGDWDRIYLSAGYSDSSHILNSIIRYGGRGNAGSIYIVSNRCPVDSSYISYSSNFGLYFNNSLSASSANEIHSNVEGIRVVGANTPVLRNNNIRDNSSYGLHNATTSTTDARQNYWGAASGPYVNQGADQNLTGTGNRIHIPNGVVQYRPFLTSRSGILLGDPSFNGSITAYDAALTLQHVVGIITFSATQQTAANVSGDATVSAYDASLILRFVVGSITGFPGSGKISVDAGSVIACNFKTEKIGDEFVHLYLNLNNALGIYATDFKLSYDVNELEFTSVQKTEVSKEMSLYHHSSDGSVDVAMAGSNPFAENGSVVKLVFKMKDAAKSKDVIRFTLNNFKLNELDMTESVREVVHKVKGLPTEFALEQNYPNPFNPLTIVNYQLPIDNVVTLKVYDMLGREVATLVDGMQEAGYYAQPWNGTDANGQQLASGIYFYRLEAFADGKQTFNMIKKMSLIR
ncbi:MAG: right-handed parallel beta-helix repeat-containing protein [Ignavibacteriae bacterium]|nr:right-handed parallel beta-helix repeat-containing protein [Ignavibacteriota bacterium]